MARRLLDLARIDPLDRIDALGFGFRQGLPVMTIAGGGDGKASVTASA